MNNLTKPHNLFFLSVLIFTGGILLANWQINLIWLVLSAAAAALFLSVIFKNKPALILLAVLLPAGGFYHYFYNNQLAPLPQLSDFINVQLPSDLMKSAYRRLLPLDQAGLLAGISLGENSDLSRDWLNRLSLSGVRHLTALSGLHITIVVIGLANVLGALAPTKRKLNFILLIILSLIFVILTGLKVSALRAAFMAVILSLSKVSERIHSPRNSLAAAGFILLIFNPNILVFDIGFQLSFLAVIGIACILPILKMLTGVRNGGFLKWKENLLMTISAQLATAPLLIYYFSNFTLTSFIANVLIIPFVPLTMALGYLMGISYYLLKPAAIIIGWLAAALLQYQLLIVYIFSAIKLPFNPQISWRLIGVYYLMLGAVVWLFRSYGKTAKN